MVILTKFIHLRVVWDHTETSSHTIQKYTLFLGGCDNHIFNIFVANRYPFWTDVKYIYFEKRLLDNRHQSLIVVVTQSWLLARLTSSVED